MANFQRVLANGGGGGTGGLGKESPFVDNESLLYLENLMTEFFYSNTTNERKKQIETILSEFSSLSNSWQMSFAFFERTTNEYTKMFCLTVMETFVGQRWHTVPNDVRIQFRASLWKHLLETHSQLTIPIRNKLCKVVVLVTRFDWPYSYPNFMPNILELLSPESIQNIAHSSSLILLGLTFVGIIVEEFATTTANVNNNNSYNFSSARQLELTKLIETNLPNILQSLESLLDLISTKHINFISATPPPSPSHSPPNSFLNLNKADDTLNNISQMGCTIRSLLDSIPEMDQEFIQMTSKIFSCFSQIIPYMPVTYYQNISDNLLLKLCFFVTFGTINPSYNSAKLGIDAMNCINELMSKASSFNSQENDFMYNLFRKMFVILQLITTSLKPLNGGAGDSGVDSLGDDIDDLYLTKCIIFLKLFISGHLGRFEKFITFPTKEFLTLLFEFTTKMQRSLECYLMLLDVWTIYLEYLQTSLDDKHKDKSVIEQKSQSAKEPLFSLLVFLIRSIQYSCNRDYLQQLDDSTVDDDSKTEYQIFIQNSIEIIATIANIYPEETINYFDNHCFSEKVQNIYYGLEYYVNNKTLEPVNNNNYYNNNNNNNNNNGASSVVNPKLFPVEMCHQPLGQLQLSIHDFITTMQVLSRFSHFFVDEFFDQYFSRTKIIFDKFFQILQFIDLHKFSDPHTSPNPLLGEFLLLKAQILATFKAYIVWFQQFGFAKQSPNGKANSLEQQQQFNTEAEPFITIIFNSCCSIICDTRFDGNSKIYSAPIGGSDVFASKEKLFHSASLTLYTFSGLVRPSFVFGLASVQRLIDQSTLASVLQLGANSNCANGVAEVKSNPNRMVLSPSISATSPISLTDQILISQSISNLLILPWFSPQNVNQEWERRSISLNIFVGNFLQLFNKLNIDSNAQFLTSSNSDLIVSQSSKFESDQRKCPNVYCRSLYILKNVIKSHADSPVKSKQLLLMTLNSSLEAFTQLLVQNTLLHSTVTGCQITEHILALFIVVFDVLLPQTHIDFVKRTIQTLLQIINRHDLQSSTITTTSNNGGQQSTGTLKQISALKVIIKFIKLLILIIKQTSFNSALRSLLPEIIDYTVIHIQNNLIGIKSTASVAFRNATGHHYDTYCKLLKFYYQFLHELLLNNSRYFFPKSNLNKIAFANNGPASTIHHAAAASTSVSSQQQEATSQHHFENIIEIIGQSFLQPENIQLYGQNIQALESLNRTIKLFSRDPFKAIFLDRFTYLFIQTLLDRSLDLLNEPLHLVVYHLAEVDFANFYELFVPKFLANIQHLTDQQRTELINNLNHGRHSQSRELQIDFPTFMANLNRLLCDIRFYHKCNSV